MPNTHVEVTMLQLKCIKSLSTTLCIPHRTCIVPCSFMTICIATFPKTSSVGNIMVDQLLMVLVYIGSVSSRLTIVMLCYMSNIDNLVFLPVGYDNHVGERSWREKPSSQSLLYTRINASTVQLYLIPYMMYTREGRIPADIVAMWDSLKLIPSTLLTSAISQLTMPVWQL